MFLGIIKQDDIVIGIAPLRLEGEKASFIGDAAVCDYLDFVIAPGKEPDFFNILLDALKDKGINHLDLESLRPDSTVMSYLVGVAKERQYTVSCKVTDVSLELDLPDTWDEYLETLTVKQRHEVRRKLRRLEEMGEVNFRVSQGSQRIAQDVALFIRLFRKSRQEKANFMNTRMRAFFRLLAGAMAELGLLRLGFLELNSAPVAAVMYFDYNNKIYLYNSSYDPQYSQLSIGLLSKVLCLKDSIERKKSRFDFLRGAEVYKYRLGGREIPLYRCQLVIK